MEYAVKSRSRKYNMLIEAILPSIIKQLKLTKSKKFLLVEIGHSAGEGNDGCTVPLTDLDSYVITIKPGRLHEMGITLAHEMVHVKQLARGVLKTKNGNKYWRGKRYSKNTKYLNTPWELEAFAKQEILFRRAIERLS
jgi:hypothetical protein